MNNQDKYLEVKNKLDSAKTLKTRLDTQLEQKEKELANVKAQLIELAGTDDVEKIEELLEQLNEQIEQQMAEAEKIIAESGL